MMPTPALIDKLKRRPFTLLLTVVVFFILAYWPVFLVLAKKWADSEEYSHAFLTLPIIAYMIWHRRSAFDHDNARFTALGMALMVLAILFYPFALILQMRTILGLSMCMMASGVIVYLGGVGFLKTLATPLILLVLLIPIPDQLYVKLTFPLQLKVSQISEVLVRMVGVPIFREGNVMNIPAKSFEVVEACSGLRSMITLITLSVIMGYFLLQKTLFKLVLIVFSVPTAVIINVLRVVIMIVLFYYFRLDLSEGSLHTVTGILIFIIALMILLALQRLMDRWRK